MASQSVPIRKKCLCMGFIILAGIFWVPAGVAEQPSPEPLGTLPAGAPMHFTIGNDVALQVIPLEQAKSQVQEIATGAKTAKVTAFEPYVKWMLLQPEDNRWDFTYYDMQVGLYQQQGIRWVPFLIAGPAYATPGWFKESKESVFARCLEHNEQTRTQSIWNPHLRQRVETLMEQFAAHFDPGQIQSLLLGISGDFGETIYTVSGNGWTYIWDGEYHQHAGWWCGDEYAGRDFQRKMQEQYQQIENLNAAWGSHFAGFEEVKPFIPTNADLSPGETVSRRARLDMIRWYRQSMTEYAEFWLQICKKYLPKVPVLLCTGGDGSAMLGADFSQQAILAARYGYGIRITNEGSNYADNFAGTRWVGSACRNLGTYFGYEPAGEVNERGIAARIYNAAASGADELFIYDNPPAGERGAIYARYHSLLVKREPKVPVAVFLSKTSQELGLLRDIYPHAALFRDYTDFDYLDESLIEQGFLDRYQVLVWTDGAVTEEKTLQQIEKWTLAGGILYCYLQPENVEGKVWKLPAKDFAVSPSSLASFFEQIALSHAGLIPDGRADQVYWTRFKNDSVLILNFSDQSYEINDKKIEPGEIREFQPDGKN